MEKTKWCKFHNIPMSRCNQTSSKRCEEITITKKEAIEKLSLQAHGQEFIRSDLLEKIDKFSYNI